MSPYARKGEVNHDVLDATSGLRFIQDNWGLDPLAGRTATATSIVDAFDFANGPRAPQLLPIAPAEVIPTTGAIGAVYWTYGSAAAVIALMLIFAALLPLTSRALMLLYRGRHRVGRTGARSP